MSGDLVTVIIPARNEAEAIEECLDHVLKQDYLHDQLEVIVVDGSSTDDTAAIARRVLEASDLARWAVLENPRMTTPTSLNIALAHAGGRFVCRVDARSLIPAEYVSRCVELLESLDDARAVGGVQHAIAGAPTVAARGIARALNNRLGMGLARYRRRVSSGPADTVYLGAFRRADLDEAGGWDDAWSTNQDFELNRRLAADGVLWFDADLAVDYIARPTYRQLWRQYVRFGQWKARYWRTVEPPRPRQLLLLTAVPAVALAGLVLLVRPGTRKLAVAGTLTGCVLLEVVGAHERDPLPVRGAALLAAPVIGGGWLAGAWSGLIAPYSGRTGHG